MRDGHCGLRQTKTKGEDAKGHLNQHQEHGPSQPGPLLASPTTRENCCSGEGEHNNDHRHRRHAMGENQLAGLSSSQASLPCPSGGHATTEQALHKDR